MKRGVVKGGIAGLLGLGLLAGCGEGTGGEGGLDLAARAYDRILTFEALGERIPDELSPEDSIELARRVIDTWLREQVLVEQARTALPAEDQDFAEELASYERALLTHAYEDRYVAERLNPKVSEAEARAYYDNAPELFALNDFVVRATFLHLPTASITANVRGFIEQTLMSNDSSDVTSLEVWCLENAAIHSVGPDVWWNLDDLLREVPLQLYRPDRQLADRRLITFDQDGRTYFLRFWEHATAGEPAPFAAVQDQINELILHSRREALLADLQEQLLKAAWQAGNLATREAEAGSESLAAGPH